MPFGYTFDPTPIKELCEKGREAVTTIFPGLARGGIGSIHEDYLPHTFSEIVSDVFDRGCRDGEPVRTNEFYAEITKTFAYLNDPEAYLREMNGFERASIYTMTMYMNWWHENRFVTTNEYHSFLEALLDDFESGYQSVFELTDHRVHQKPEELTIVAQVSKDTPTVLENTLLTNKPVYRYTSQFGANVAVYDVHDVYKGFSFTTVGPDRFEYPVIVVENQDERRPLYFGFATVSQNHSPTQPPGQSLHRQP